MFTGAAVRLDHLRNFGEIEFIAPMVDLHASARVLIVLGIIFLCGGVALRLKVSILLSGIADSKQPEQRWTPGGCHRLS